MAESLQASYIIIARVMWTSNDSCFVMPTEGGSDWWYFYIVSNKEGILLFGRVPFPKAQQGNKYYRVMQKIDFKFPGDFVSLSTKKEIIEAWLVLDLMRNAVRQLLIAFELYQNACDKHFKRQELIKKCSWTAESDSEYPFGYSESEVDLHSHSILYVIDRYIKLLGRLKKYDNVKAIAIKYHDRIKHHFPDVHDVRDSSQHIIERVQGLGKNEFEIPLSKDDIWKIAVNEPNVLIYTTSQGKEGRLNITEQTITLVTTHFQSLLKELPWMKFPHF